MAKAKGIFFGKLEVSIQKGVPVYTAILSDYRTKMRVALKSDNYADALVEAYERMRVDTGYLRGDLFHLEGIAEAVSVQKNAGADFSNSRVKMSLPRTKVPLRRR